MVRHWWGPGGDGICLFPDDGMKKAGVMGAVSAGIDARRGAPDAGKGPGIPR